MLATRAVTVRPFASHVGTNFKQHRLESRKGIRVAQVWIEIEENENCGYFPIQVFEARGVERVADSAIIEHLGRQQVVGWEDGVPAEVRVVPVGDSGAGESLLIYGGNNGVRCRPASSSGPWSVDNEGESGEPYLLLAANTAVELDSNASE